MITISGNTRYHEKYPPANAKKGYVAKITGRAPGAVKYAREFLGDSVTLVDSDDAGLYERQDGEKKGGYTRYYYVVLPHPEHGLIRTQDCEDDLPKIAKLLDDGHRIEDIVAPIEIRPASHTPGLFLVTEYEIRTPGQARAATKTATIESAIDACWDAVKDLDPKQAKKVVSELRKRITEATATSQ